MIKDVRYLFPIGALPTYRKKRPGGAADVKIIAIHYTYSSISSTATEAEELAHLQVIHEMHLNNGNGGMPYHGIAFPSGRRYYTFDMSRWGANVPGRNDEVIGFAGVFKHHNVPSLKIREGLSELIGKADTYVGVKVPLKGHRELTSTSCPGAAFAQWVPNLRQEDDMAMTNAELEAALKKLRSDATVTDNKLKTDLAKLRSDATLTDAAIKVRLDALEAAAASEGLKRGDKVTLS